MLADTIRFITLDRSLKGNKANYCNFTVPELELLSVVEMGGFSEVALKLIEKKPIQFHGMKFETIVA